MPKQFFQKAKVEPKKPAISITEDKVTFTGKKIMVSEPEETFDDFEKVKAAKVREAEAKWINVEKPKVSSIKKDWELVDEEGSEDEFVCVEEKKATSARKPKA